MYNEASQELGSFSIHSACQQPSQLDSLRPSSFHSADTRHPVHRGPEVRRLKNSHVSHQEGFWLLQKLPAAFSFQRTRAETGLENSTYEEYIKQAAAGCWMSIQLKVCPRICTYSQHHSNRPCVKARELIWLLLHLNREPATAFIFKKKKTKQWSKLAESHGITD